MIARYIVVCGWAFLSLPYLAGQKAGPVPIQFKPGAVSAVVKGKLRGRQQMEYSASVRERQNLTLGLIGAPSGTLKLCVRDPEGTELPLRRSGCAQWSVTLLHTGFFEIWVLRTSDKDGASSYRLTITIR